MCCKYRLHAKDNTLNVISILVIPKLDVIGELEEPEMEMKEPEVPSKPRGELTATDTHRYIHTHAHLYFYGNCIFLYIHIIHRSTKEKG